MIESLMNLPEIIQLFIAFLIPGLIGFGGGVASIGIVQQSVVDIFGLLSAEDFNVIIVLSNSLPGPVATLLAIGTGFLKMGILGSIVALTAIVAPSAILVIALFEFLSKNKNDYRAKRMSKYILPVIIALFFGLVYQVAKSSFLSIGNTKVTIALLVISFVAIVKFKVNPIYLIILSMIFGYFCL